MVARTALGIHIGHDRGAAVVADGRLVAQLAEERLDRRKHSESPELPLKAISAVLEIAGLRTGDVGTVGISYTNVVVGNIVEQLASELRELLNRSDISVHGVGHHDCHAWSTYCTADVNRALILVADGAGDFVENRLEAESLYLGEGGRVRLLDRRLQDAGLTRTARRNAFNLAYMNPLDRAKQISLGRKYEQFTYLLGFGHGEAGKTMALASYAPPLFQYARPATRGLHFSLTFDDGLAELDRLWKASGEPWHRYVHRNAPAIAATAQNMLEVHVENLLQTLDIPNEETLCAAGGVFLNCRLNARVLNNTPIKKLHVIPAAGDDGQCVGAAFAAYSTEYGKPRCSSSSLPYLGRSYGTEEISERLAYFHLRAKHVPDNELTSTLAADIAGGRTVALLRGRSEFGPRALCHRSLLADPRRSDMPERLNYLKSRELFRPFAPVVIAEEQRKYFDLVQASPYMLLAANVHEQFRSVLPGVTHVDGTARVQSIAAEQDPFMHALLRAFELLTGFPVLINTSFNLGGDPIVETPHDAIVTFLGADIDILVLENFYIKKRRIMGKSPVRR